MKGIVFTEFLQLVEEKFGYETVDQILLAADPENDGAYTAIGTYDHQVLIRMVVELSGKVDVPVPDLVNVFGRYLFGKFATNYSAQLSVFNSSFELIEKVEDYIHVEVRKLYPNAELPKFSYEKPNENTLEMTYRSTRPFADLCEGLVAQCIEHFGDDATYSRQDLADDGTSARFTLERKPALV